MTEAIAEKGDRIAVESVRYAVCFNRILDHNVIPAYEPESEDEIPDQVRDDMSV